MKVMSVINKLLAGILILLVVFVLTYGCYMFADDLSTKIADNMRSVDATVVSVGKRGIQVEYEGSYGEVKTVTISTSDAYDIGDTVRISLFFGKASIKQ